jgi:hypothetical protein
MKLTTASSGERTRQGRCGIPQKHLAQLPGAALTGVMRGVAVCRVQHTNFNLLRPRALPPNLMP